MPLPEVVSVEPDGTVMYRQQYVGPLSQRLTLQDFPLDTQTFWIQFAIAGAREGDVDLVPAEFPGGRGGRRDGRGPVAARLGDPPLQGRGPPVQSHPVRCPAGLRLHLHGQAPQPILHLAGRHAARADRDDELGAVLGRPAKGGDAVRIASSTVLTLIAFRFILASMLPPLPYLTPAGLPDDRRDGPGLRGVPPGRPDEPGRSEQPPAGPADRPRLPALLPLAFAALVAWTLVL